MKSTWQKALDSISQKINAHSYETWFKPLTYLSCSEDTIFLQVPKKFLRDWIVDNFMDLLTGELAQQANRPIRVEFVLAESLQAEPADNRQEQQQAEDSPTELMPPYTFERFVVGPSNEFAHAACLAIAEKPGHSYNPLFIYGGVGLGKTHLLHAVGNSIHSSHPHLNLLYLSSEQYINDLISCIRANDMDGFRAKYREQCDVLLMDDIQFIAGKDRTQDEFFHMFNRLYDGKKQIVITSDRFPQDIPGLEERLTSRFNWGLIADIQPPEIETRVLILKKKAELQHFDLPNDTAMFVASRITGNVRQLEGCLLRLEAFSRLNSTKATVEVATQALHDLLQVHIFRATVDRIQETVAAHFDVKVSDLKGARRHRGVTLPRQIAMFLCRKYSGASFPEIGNKFGGRDHSTVVSSVKKIQKLFDGDFTIRKSIEEIERSLKR